MRVPCYHCVRIRQSIKRFCFSKQRSPSAQSCSDRHITDAVTCVLLNTRSVYNKPLTDKEHTIDKKTVLMVLTESWCKPSKTALINEIIPQSYRFIGECHSSKRVGGVGLLYKSSYKSRKTTTTKRHDTFENWPFFTSCICRFYLTCACLGLPATACAFISHWIHDPLMTYCENETLPQWYNDDIHETRALRRTWSSERSMLITSQCCHHMISEHAFV